MGPPRPAAVLPHGFQVLVNHPQVVLRPALGLDIIPAYVAQDVEIQPPRVAGPPREDWLIGQRHDT